MENIKSTLQIVAERKAEKELIKKKAEELVRKLSKELNRRQRWARIFKFVRFVIVAAVKIKSVK